jgi:acid phosphatase type 7
MKLNITAWLLPVTVLFLPFPGYSQSYGVAGPTAAPVELFRGPYLQVATTSSIIIRWRTSVTTRSRVRYGTNAAQLDQMADDSSLVTEHVVRLKGLLPKKKYFYSIGDFENTLQGDEENYFATPPPVDGTDTCRIGVFGDCGNNSVNQRRVRDEFLNYLGHRYLTAWILLGDNAYENGTDAEFQADFFNIYKKDLLKKYPLFPAPGNHEYHAEANLIPTQETHAVAYYQSFSMPTNGEAGGVPSMTQAFYSYDIGNIHFLALDSYGEEDAQRYRLYDTLGPQVQWVKRDLEANKGKTWIIAYWHHPPYTMGNHNSDREEELVKIRENFIPILERYGVDLVLCGHSHDYERSRLMYGHYGTETTFRATEFDLSQSSGRNDGTPNSAAYHKNASNKGTVYVVSGSAGQLGGTQRRYPHDAMFFSDARHGGACLIEVVGRRLDLTWICADGIIRDRFSIVKDAPL